MNYEDGAKVMRYSFGADLALGSMYIVSFFLVTASIADELSRFYTFLGLIFLISVGVAIAFRKQGTAPIVNSYLSLGVAAIGLCLLVNVTQVEKNKVRLLPLYDSTLKKLQITKNDLHLFNIVTENKESLKQDILLKSKALPGEYQVFETNCLVMPEASISSNDVFNINDIGTYDDTPMLDDFVGETHCTQITTTVKREKLDDSMSLRELIEKSRYGSYEHDGRQYILSSLLPYADITPNSDKWNEKKVYLEKALEEAKMNVKSLEDQYQKIGNEISTDINEGSWKTKSFYLSWWNFFLIIALGYQLNSAIINRN